MNGTLLSLLEPSNGVSGFGLMKFNVVLRFGDLVSEVEVAYSTPSVRLSPTSHSAPPL